VKEMLKKSKDPYLALLTYRTTPIQGGRYSPAELLMNRMLRTTIPTTRSQRLPRVPDQDAVRARDLKTKKRQKTNFDRHHGARELPQLEPGDTVWLPEKEAEATVQAEVAPQSFRVTTAEGAQYRRNRRDFIRLPDRPERENSDSPDPPERQSSDFTEQTESTRPRRSSRVSRPPERFAPYIKH